MLEYFPDPYPDELLYSVWARFGDQVHYPNRQDIMLELFGSRSYSALVDWSCSLRYLVNRLSVDHCYTADMFINDHTLFPLYAPFFPPERRLLLREQMITGSGTALSSRMGMMTSHIPRYRWLRYCPECVKRDRDQFGETYWHRLHQAPGVEVCPAHALFLEDSTAARQPGSGVFLSAESVIHFVRPRLATISPVYHFLKDVAECIEQLLHRAYNSPGLPFFQRQYFSLLEHRGLITINGRLRVVEFLKALTEYYSPLLLSLLRCELSHTRHIEAEWPARLPYARKAQHPLHHILVLRFLSAEIESFLCSSIRPPRPFGNGPWPCLNNVCEQHRTFCICDYSVREKSFKDRPVGLFSCPFCGFTYSRVGPDHSPEDSFRRDRIPAYGRLWEIKLCEWWLEPGISIERIARQLGVDPLTVKRQAKRLALPPRRVLQKGNAKSQVERKDLQQRRKEWIRLVEEHGKDGIAALTRHIKKANTLYRWLNKYDRKWLCSHRPPRKIPKRTKVHIRTTLYSTDEDFDMSSKEDRDVLASRAIRLTAQKIVHAPGEPRKMTRAQLEKAIPSLGWLLSSPNNFPLTAQAYQEEKETREQFALRRIQWVLEQCLEESLQPTKKEFILKAKARRVLDIPSVQAAIEEALTILTKHGR